MNRSASSWRTSQVLATVSLVFVVGVMVMPFRGGERLTRVRSASLLPVLSTASLAHGSSFQARDSSPRVACSEEALFRSPVEAKLAPVRREIVVRKSGSRLPSSFDEPRRTWVHLSRDDRAALDQKCAVAKPGWVEVRSSGAPSGSWAGLQRQAELLGAGRSGFDPRFSLVVGNGRGSGDGAVEMDDRVAGKPGEGKTLAIYLVGDFFRSPPTRAQWEALDEVMDYLALKWGRVQVAVSQVGGEGGSPRQALGPWFPVEAFFRALSGPPGKESDTGQALEVAPEG